jgi:TonB family protein
LGKRSRMECRKYFVFIFFLVLLGHLSLLSLQYHPSSPEDALRRPVSQLISIKVKLVDQKRLLDEKAKQIVQSEDPETFIKPSDSKYLSDKNRFFDRQSIARNSGPFQIGGRGESNKVSSAPEKKETKKIRLSDLGQTVERHPLLSAAKRYTETGMKASFDHGRTVSSTNDYVEGIPLGDLTQINTHEYVYFSFYHRIRQKLEQFWGRSIQEKAEIIHKAGRRIASESHVITALRVTLDELGEIIAISVIGPSGVRELDDAAIEAFNLAGPFPNPPKGLIVDGQVVLEWGFVVKS